MTKNVESVHGAKYIVDGRLDTVFGRLTPAGGRFSQRGRAVAHENDPFGPRRGGSDNSRGVPSTTPACPDYPHAGDRMLPTAPRNH